MAEPASNSTPPAPPLGIFNAKVDDKGRLKLPAEFVEYLRQLNVGEVFITTLDEKQARIYSKTVWLSNLQFLETVTEAAADAADVAFLADVYGGVSGIDLQGRVLVPSELRKLLEIEGETVWLRYYKSHIKFFGKKVFDERLQRSRHGAEDKLAGLEKQGFK